MERRLACGIQVIVAAAMGIALVAAPVEAQTYRMNSAEDLANREVRIIQTNSAGTDIHIFDARTMEQVGHVGGLPHNHGAALHADGRYYYVTNEEHNTLDVVDTRTLEVVEHIPLAARPNNLSASDRARKIYVAIQGAPLVQVIDMDTHQIIKDIPTPGGVHNTFVTPDGRYAVAGMIGANTLTAIDTETDEVVWQRTFDDHRTRNPFVGGVRPFTFTTNPDGSTQYVLVNIGGWLGFWVVDWETQEVLRKVTPPIGSYPRMAHTADGIQSAPSHGIVVLPDQSEVWVSSRATSMVFSWSLPDFEFRGGVNTGGNPGGNPAWLTATPDSKYVWIGISSHGEVAVLDVERREIVRRLPVGHTPKRNYTAVFPVGWQGEVTRSAQGATR